MNAKSIMKRLSIYSGFLLSSVMLMAQLTNTGLPVGITAGAVVSGQGITSMGPVTNNGILVASGDIGLSGGYTGSGDIKLTGADQALNLGGSATPNILTVAGGGTKTIFSEVIVSGSLELNDGKVLVIGDNLRLLSSSAISGSNTSNYIIGKLIRGGAGDIDFPVGSAGQYAPVTLRGVTGNAPEVGLEYVNTDPAGQIGYGIVDLSQNRYWNISEEGGTYDGAQVEIPTISETIVTDLSEAVVAGSGTGITYRSLGQSAVSGNTTAGTVTSQDLFTTGRVALGKFFDEQLRVNDSTALVSIFTQTNGSEWLNTTGWISDDLDGWFGVTMNEKRVTDISLPSNNLSGTLPAVTTGLESTTGINLADNELTDVGELSSLAALGNLNVEENRLQFGTLESLLAQSFTTTYGDQKEVLERMRVLQQIGDTYTVNREVTGSANSYSWFDGEDPISQTGPSFDVPVTDFTDEGDFTAQVTNSNVPSLTLVTTPVLLRVSSLKRDSTSLIALYDSLDGPNWLVGNDWTQTPVAAWDGNGVTLADNRVVGIHLGDNNLIGVVPEDIVDIEGLTDIDLSGNEISGLPDMSSLSNLTTFDVSDNQLDFADLEPNAGISGISYGNQANFGTPFTTQIDRGLNYQLGFNVPGTANTYQWSLDDQPVAVATDDNYLIENIGFDNMGVYALSVTNDIVTDLTLESEPQAIWAQADIDFIPIYTDRTGDPAQLDEGEAWLFEVIPDQPYDTTSSPQVIDESGISFQDIRLGNYLMFVRTDTLLLRMDEGEVDSVKLLPTYYESTIDWAEADILQLREFISDSLFMQQQPPPLDPTKGDGIISIILESDFEDESPGRIESRRRVKKAGCSLRRRTTGGGGRPAADEEYVLIAYKETDDNGEVSFGFLPNGFYRLNIQYPGVPMDTTSFIEFEISEDEEMDGYELQATVTTEGITVEVIEELGFYRKYFKDLAVYPVPANERVTIEYKKLLAEGVEVKLVDLRGETIKRQELRKGYNQRLELDISEVDGGVYLLYFYDRDFREKSIVYYKVIIRH